MSQDKGNSKGIMGQFSEQTPSTAADLKKSGIDEALLEALVTTDLRENLPPQMLAVVVGVLKIVEGIHLDTAQLEQEAKVESKPSKR